ncbi:MAG: hypothetical protein M0Z66_07570 [Thermaerobacter sp.]|nr:hypothetical protein [Thermaerobacter sp.]
MRRLIDVLIASVLLVAPAFAIAASSAPAATAAGTNTPHYAASFTIQPDSALAPGDPGTL